MAFQIILKLKEGASPHLYVKDLKKHMDGDRTLHPLMKNSLLLLKKSRMPYIRLANKKEMVFITEDLMHLERILEPEISGWTRIKWSPEECDDYLRNPKKYLKEVFEMYTLFGYEFFGKKLVPESQVEQLKEITEPKKKKK